MRMNKRMVACLLFSVVLCLPANVMAQDATLEILDAPAEVIVAEDFSFSVRIENAVGYSYFSLTGTGPDGDLTWGTHVFDDDYIIYTEDYTISLRQEGYYTLQVTAGAIFGGVPEITESFQVHVVAESEIPLPLLYFIGFIAFIALISVPYYLNKKSKEKQRTEVKPSLAEEFMILCPNCGKKTELGFIKCHHCGAEL